MTRALLAAALLLLSPATLLGFYNLPPLPPPEEYGNLLIDRLSSRSGLPPVFFSHWSHRIRYTCEVCHNELGFNMLVNTTEITAADHRQGRYCGACHDGRTAFSTETVCVNCHSGDIAGNREKFVAFFSRKPFPTTSFGNGIDWVRSLQRGLISPVRQLQERPEPMSFDRTLLLEAEVARVPPAVFPHREHLEWMECNTCHPEVFNIKKKTTRHFSMAAILDRQFCGACHLNVAFPLDDCARCHPGIRER